MLPIINRKLFYANKPRIGKLKWMGWVFYTFYISKDFAIMSEYIQNAISEMGSQYCLYIPFMTNGK